MDKILKSYKKNIFLISLLVLFGYLGFVWESDFINMVALVSGVLCVYNAGQQNISTFYFGIINSAAYAYTSYIAGLNGEFMLNAFFYLPIQFLGIYAWKKHMSNNKVESKSLNKKKTPLYVFIVIVLIGLFGSFLSGINGQLTPYLDSTTTVLSIVAQIMMIKMLYQQWYIYIIINILSILMWINVGDSSMILMWSAYLANSFLGLMTWRSSYDNKTE